MSQIGNNPSGGLVDGGGAKPLDFGTVNQIQDYTAPIDIDKFKKQFSVKPTITDGGMCLNDEGKKVGCNSLITNGKAQLPSKSKGYYFRKLAGAYNQNLIIAVVLVAGYFAYKKFKK
jgi:hypothetical protein